MPRPKAWALLVERFDFPRGGLHQCLASAITLIFQDIINANDPTFNQELGINNTATIAGYFGSGAAGHPNLGYTVLPPFGQANFTAENFPGSAQTQVTGLNNVGTTVGFFSGTNNGGGTDSNFGFSRIGGSFVQVKQPEHCDH